MVSYRLQRAPLLARWRCWSRRDGVGYRGKILSEPLPASTAPIRSVPPRQTHSTLPSITGHDMEPLVAHSCGVRRSASWYHANLARWTVAATRCTSHAGPTQRRRHCVERPAHTPTVWRMMSDRLYSAPVVCGTMRGGSNLQWYFNPFRAGA